MSGMWRKGRICRKLEAGDRPIEPEEKDITKEPEMKELKRMIREGELDQERTLEHLRQKKS